MVSALAEVPCVCTCASCQKRSLQPDDGDEPPNKRVTGTGTAAPGTAGAGQQPAAAQTPRPAQQYRLTQNLTPQGNPVVYRQLKVEDALAYLDQVGVLWGHTVLVSPRCVCLSVLQSTGERCGISVQNPARGFFFSSPSSTPRHALPCSRPPGQDAVCIAAHDLQPVSGDHEEL